MYFIKCTCKYSEDTRKRGRVQINGGEVMVIQIESEIAIETERSEVEM